MGEKRKEVKETVNIADIVTRCRGKAINFDRLRDISCYLPVTDIFGVRRLFKSWTKL